MSTELLPPAAAQVPAVVAPLPADRNPAAVYVASLVSPNSRKGMRTALETAARTMSGDAVGAADLDWTALRFQHVAAMRAALLGGRAPATVNGILAAVRGVANAAWKLGFINAEDLARIRDGAKSVKNETLPAGRALGMGELRALFEACAGDETPAGRRDAAMLAVLYGAGLRCAELCGLGRDDFDAETGRLVVRAGKGRKQRVAHATNGSATALRAWLAIRGDEAGALFVAVNKSGRLEYRQLNTATVWAMIQRRATMAGVRDVSPHDFRRTFITHLLDANADLVTVQRMAGHKKLETTARYDRRGEESQRKASELLHVPV